jgi:hypothetical protein
VRIAGWTIVLLILVGSDLSISAQQPDSKDVQVQAQDEGRLRAMARRLGSLASPEEDEGLAVSAGIIVAGSSLSGGVG